MRGESESGRGTRSGTDINTQEKMRVHGRGSPEDRD